MLTCSSQPAVSASASAVVRISYSRSKLRRITMKASLVSSANAAVTIPSMTANGLVRNR